MVRSYYCLNNCLTKSELHLFKVNQIFLRMKLSSHNNEFVCFVNTPKFVGTVFSGSESSFLRGQDGKDGRDGRDGKDGRDGRDGEKGQKGEGESNYTGVRFHVSLHIIWPHDWGTFN